MSRTITYYKGDTLPAWEETISIQGADDVDFSTGWTFTLDLTKPGEEDDIEKTIGFTGSVGKVTVQWDEDELDITPGTWRGRLRCTRTSPAGRFTTGIRLYIRE